MKSIVFMMINMNVGGTEKALLNLLNNIDKKQYKVTILMLEKKGGFLNHIPDWVEVKVVNEYEALRELLNDPPQKVALKLIKSGKVIFGISVLLHYIWCKLVGEMSVYYRYILKDIKIIDNNYDIAVAYAGPMNLISYFVLNKIIAKTKIQWIHFDINKININNKFSRKIFTKFNNLYVVSKAARDNLVERFPEIKDKTEVFYNIISKEQIISLSKNGQGFDDDFDGIRILTVGRLCREKGQDLAIGALEKLIKAGYKVKWYCVGEGPSRGYYEDIAKSKGIADSFVLLGATTNPYIYMNECDIYVQPSRHEGYCITLAEARCFSNPIVTTDFSGAREQIIDNETGLICTVDENEIYLSIKKLLDNNKLYSYIKENLYKKNSNNINNSIKVIL